MRKRIVDVNSSTKAMLGFVIKRTQNMDELTLFVKLFTVFSSGLSLTLPEDDCNCFTRVDN